MTDQALGAGTPVDLRGLPFLAVAAMVLTGCLGTIESRFVPPFDPKADNSAQYYAFGGHPYDAVNTDLHLVGGGDSFFQKTVGVVSIPLDLVFDTAFIPLDLVAWCFGCHKPGVPFIVATDP